MPRNYTNGKSDKALIGHIGFDGPVKADTSQTKHILITGAGSYIGKSFIRYAKEHYNKNFIIDEMDMMDDIWKNVSFSEYDIIYHVAGIAHADVGNVSDEVKEKYYCVNTDLAVEVAKKAKADGAKKFVFMSSMIVYGDSAPYGKEKIVTGTTVPKPANFYGDSKLQADVAVRDLADDSFKVAVLRPPMIYGKGSKGNYPLLAKIAKKVPVFPKVKNQRSMLYIGNLCEFLCQLFLVEADEFSNEGNVFIPQNAEWTNTSDMVKMIAESNGKKIALSRVLALAVVIGGKMPGKIGKLVNKAFGNNCYELELSFYEGIFYTINNIIESIRFSEE